MDINKLMKPCPFCGQKIATVACKVDGTGCVWLDVDCPCGAHIEIEADDIFYLNGTPHKTGKDAIEKWNTRASEQTEPKKCYDCRHFDICDIRDSNHDFCRFEQIDQAEPEEDEYPRNCPYNCDWDE